MQKPAERTSKMLLMSTEEEVFARVIGADHPFRKLNEIINWPVLVEPLRALYSDLGAIGIDVERGVKALLIQFWEDYSDREMEKALKENLALKWFCGFGLTEQTPDYSYFSKLRKRLGTKTTADLFNGVNATLKEYGLFGNVFTFIDASAIITKTVLWEERDRAIKDGETTLNNALVSKYAVDTDARWGAKSKTKVWFGYKRHQAVDMRYGLIRKTTVTPANVVDYKALRNICPNQGMVLLDKLYDCEEANWVLASHGCHSATIRKNNNKRKNRDLDRWRSGVRMPFESVFSKVEKRARYRGQVKVAMQCFLEALTHNLKKAIRFAPNVIPHTQDTVLLPAC